MACHKLFRAEATSISLTVVSYPIREQHSIIQTQNHSTERPPTLEYWGGATKGQSVWDPPGGRKRSTAGLG